ncbi:hypothetical protein FHX74_003296 [Friedmanniella endophytica]|uniref:Uncharacterized protein n=1 Tax=Microlunatus kandeliicorticis TaxID=1759536 RepID=A0A7W3P768_9ACTN|nr:hypothetical protein [Microlunatus kandeliicorticis]MBA8795660.1 hypothetical protein [Microlunatus kandeliicorticis]
MSGATAGWLAALVHGLAVLGFALWAGPLIGWLTTAPGRPTPLLGRLHRLGLLVLVLTAAGALVLGLTGSDRLLGAAALARVALLVATAALRPDLTRPPVSTRARALGLVLVGLVAVTVVLTGAVVRRPDWPLASWAAGLLLVGVAGWAGALIALVAGSERDTPPGADAAVRGARARLAAATAGVVAALGALAGVLAALTAPSGAGAAPGPATAALVGVGLAALCTVLAVRPANGTGTSGALTLPVARPWLAAALVLSLVVLLLGSAA